MIYKVTWETSKTVDFRSSDGRCVSYDKRTGDIECFNQSPLGERIEVKDFDIEIIEEYINEVNFDYIN